MLAYACHQDCHQTLARRARVWLRQTNGGVGTLLDVTKSCLREFHRRLGSDGDRATSLKLERMCANPMRSV